METKEDIRTALLRKIRYEVVDFKEPSLYKERVENKVHPVIGERSHYAEIMCVGEAPGRTEALTGSPFAGAAGKVLTDLLASAGIERKDVYITNIDKSFSFSPKKPFQILASRRLCRRKLTSSNLHFLIWRCVFEKIRTDFARDWLGGRPRNYLASLEVRGKNSP